MQHVPSYTKQQHISVIIPVFNEEKLIKECLDAIAKQTQQPDAVYIVDNNSTDRSMDIARSYPFVTIVHERTQGICASTKTGFDVAAKNGGLLLRLDADCRPKANWIQRASAIFGANTSAVAVTGPGITYDASPIVNFLITIFYMQPYFIFVGIALGQKPLFGSNFTIRASSWQKISSKTHLASHQNIHDDIDISYHLVGQGRIVYDGSLKMPMSSRPFRTPFPNLIKRYTAGFRSIFIHWPQQAPWKNWWERLRKSYK